MSYQVGSACYGTALQAAQASASSLVGAVVQAGPTSYVVDVSAVSDTSITYSFNPVGGGSPVVQQVPYTAQPCNLLTWSDGVELGWLVVAVWIAVYGVLFLRRALSGEYDNGNA